MTLRVNTGAHKVITKTDRITELWRRKEKGGRENDGKREGELKGYNITLLSHILRMNPADSIYHWTTIECNRHEHTKYKSGTSSTLNQWVHQRVHKTPFFST